MEESSNGTIGKILKRWFKGTANEEPAVAAVPSPVVAQPMRRASPPPDKDGGTGEDIIPRVKNISEKIIALRNAVEFDARAKSSLNQVDSERELVKYCYETLLRKFMNLEEIGILSPESTFVLNTLGERFESVLQQPENTATPEDLSEKKALEEENRALKSQVKNLQARYVKSGIISEREIQLEGEIKYLKRREKELQIRLKIFEKRCQALMEGAALISELRAKNGLLSSRLRNQAQLLDALSEGSVKKEQLIETVQGLRAENRHLQEQLEKPDSSFDRIEKQLPEDSNIREALGDLLTRNKNLHGELADRSQRLDDLSSIGSTANIPDTIEMLSDENFRLKAMIETKQALNDLMENPARGKLNSQRVIEVLNTENQRLQQTLAAKKEQVKILASRNPSSGPAVKALIRLRDENKELKRAIDLRDRTATDWEIEKKQMVAQVKKAVQIAKENQQFRPLVEQNGLLAQRLKDVELKYQTTRKDYSALVSKHDTSLREMQQTKAKLARTTAEYELLVKEYENIFGQFGKAD